MLTKLFLFGRGLFLEKRSKVCFILHRRHQIFHLMGTALAVLNVKTNKSKANNMKQIIHFLGK